MVEFRFRDLGVVSALAAMMIVSAAAQVGLPAPGQVSTVAGTGVEGPASTNVQATSATLNYPTAAVVDQAGNVYFADGGNNVIRKVNAATGVITTVAGNGSQCNAGTPLPCGDSGAATSAALNTPVGVAVDSAGNLYIADGGYCCAASSYGTVRYVSAQTGVITSLVSGLAEISGVILDGKGNLYISWSFGNGVEKLNLSTLALTNVAGSFNRGYTGDGGPATSANLCSPGGIALDSLGNLFIADSANNIVREVTASTGIITTVAGTPPAITQDGNMCGDGNFGMPGQGDGGSATAAELGDPAAVAVDQNDNIFIADNGRIRKVAAANGNIYTVAGGGTSLANNILAIHAEAGPLGLAFDSRGNLYYADASDELVRVVGALGSFSEAVGSVSSLTTSVHPSAYGQSTTFTDQISTSGVAPTGSVTFSSDGVAIGSSSVSAISATNLLPYSNTLTSWSYPGVTIYTNAGTAPDGSSTSTKFQVGSGFLFYESASCSPGAVTGSIYVKQGQANPVPDMLLYIEFDNSSGTKISSVTSPGVALTSSWQRLTYSATAPSGTTSCLFQPWMVGPSLARNSATNGQTALVWGAQLEQASTAGPYVATTTAAKSGNGGQATLAYADLTPGSHMITAQYSGDTVVTGSTSPFIYQTVVTSGEPTISISPTSGPIGSSVTISGSGFGSTQGSSIVLFDGLPATVTSWSATAIVVTVPSGATTGPIAINVNGESEVSPTFTVVAPAPPALYSYSIPSGGYDAVGNVHSYVDSVMGTWVFGYDHLNRLSTAVETAAPANNSGSDYVGQNLCMFYDSFGNRTESNFQTTTCTVSNPTVIYGGSKNQITNNLYTYDAAGNVTFDGNNWYSYDGDGRLCSLQTTGPTSGMVAYGYIYDAEGRRVAKGTIAVTSTPLICNPNTTTNGFQLTESYVLDQSGQELTMLDQNGKPQRTNVFAGSQLVATYDSTNLHFHLTDPLGTRRMQVSAAGVVEGTFQSLPFGDKLTSSGNDSTPLHYTGKERDTESGLDYFGARYFGSNMGRFMSADPNFESARKADPQTWNRYTYGLNNPLRFIDPTGELWQQNMNGGWDWGTWCPIGATCRTEFAQQEGNNTVVYGPSSAKDKQSFAANSSGYVNVADIAATDGAYFGFQSGVTATYASPQTAADLYNGAFDYHLDYPGDSKLSLNDIGKSDGSMFGPHKTHNLGRSVDMAYMGQDGKPIHAGNLSVWLADDERMMDLVNIFKQNGFNQNYSDNNEGLGVGYAPGHMNHIHFGKDLHTAQCEIGPCR